MAAAAACLGFGLQLSNGNLESKALLAVTFALLANFTCLLLSRKGWRIEEGEETWLVVILFLGLMLQFTALITAPPTSQPMIFLKSPEIFTAGVVTAALLAGALLTTESRLGALALMALVAVHFRLGAWIIQGSPNPAIDVVLIHRLAIVELLHGHNPYLMTFPNIYGNAQSQFYGEGLVVNGRLQVGFPYPPLSLLLAASGQIILRDYRYALLLCQDLAALLIGFSQSRRTARLAAALFLFTPRVFFVLEQGWTDSFVVCGLAAVTFYACRRSKPSPILFGLFLALKQYLVLTLALLRLLWGPSLQWREFVRLATRAVVTATLITLPWALWGIGGFVRSVLIYQVRQPFRTDALSYLAEIARRGGPHLPSSVGFAAALLALWFALRSARPTPSGFCAALAMVYGCFFAFNKQAFCNYYYFLIGALCCAVAAARLEIPPAAESSAAETVEREADVLADSHGKRIGIVIVTYNAVTTLAGVLERIPARVWDNVEEVLVCDDASTDGTYDLAVRMQTAAALSKLTVLTNSSNQGYGGNQKQGYKYFIDKGFDVAVLLHGDGQYSPELLAHMYAPLVAGDADAVFGSRMMSRYGGPIRGGMPLYKYVGNLILSSFENWALHMRLTEFHSGYRAYNLHALQRVDMTHMTNDFHFDTEIIIKLNHQGYRIREVPIPTYYGDEICYVNGMRYARDVVASVLRYKRTMSGQKPYPEYQEYLAGTKS